MAMAIWWIHSPQQSVDVSGCQLSSATGHPGMYPDVRDRALLYYSCRRYSASRCIVSKDRCLVLERKKCARDMHWVKATNINDGYLPQSIHLQLYIHSFGGGLLLRRFYRSCFAFFCMFVLPSQIILGSIALTLKLLHGPGRSFPILAVWVPQKSSSGMSLEANDFRFLNLHHDTSCVRKSFEVASMNFNPLATYVEERQGKRVIRKVWFASAEYGTNHPWGVPQSWRTWNILIYCRHWLPECHIFFLNFVF